MRKKAKAVTQAELHQFQALHAHVALAHEQHAHARTRGELAAARHEAHLHQAALAHNSAMRAADAQLRDSLAAVDAAKGEASAFAKALSQAYDVDLKTHAICPLTGQFKDVSGESDA